MARQVQIRRRVGQDVVLACEPLEPQLDRGQILRLHANAQGLAIGLAVVEQVALVALDHGPDDLGGRVNAALVYPADELADVLASGAHGVCAVAGDRHPFEVFFHVAHQQLARQRVNLVVRWACRFDGGAFAGLEELAFARHGVRRLRVGGMTPVQV